MVSRKAVLLSCFACLALEVQSVSPVQKVLALIDEMAVKVKGDKDTAAAEFKTFALSTFKSARDKDYALKSSSENIEALNAAILDAKSTIDSHGAQIADLSTKISDASTELDRAKALRQKEHEDFLASEKELVSNVEAISSVNEAQSFAQLTPDAERGIKALQQGLGRMADAGFVLHGRAEKVTAFLQSREDGEAGTPETDTLQVVQERFEESLTGARRQEQEAAAAHSSMMMGAENEIKGLQKELAQCTKGKQVAKEELAQAQKDLAIEEKGHGEDEAFLHELKRDFDSKARDFEVEFRDAAAELKALGEATAILERKFASFLEAGVKSSLRLAAPPSDGQKVRALRLIQQVGQRLHSTAMVSLAYRAAGDPFGKVRGMIEDMLEKLNQQAAEAADQQAFCNEEQGKSRKSKDEKEQSLAKTDARIEKAESATATLAEQKTMLSTEVANLDAEMKEATDIRTSERAIFGKTEKDLSESVDACGAAIQVLREYYEGAASLLQAGSQAKVASRTKAQDGSGILGVLEFASSDFEKQLSDMRVAERQAVDKYDKLAMESKQLRAVKEVEIKSKESEAKSLKTALADYNEDKEGVSAELQAVVDYLAELKPKCEADAPPSYAEKKARRDQEMQGLKDALKILE